MEGYRLLRKDGQGRGGGAVTLYVTEQLECTDLCLGVDGELTKSLWVRTQGSAGTGDVRVEVCRGSHEDQVDEAFYRQIGAASRPQALVLTGDFNHTDIC